MAVGVTDAASKVIEPWRRISVRVRRSPGFRRYLAHRVESTVKLRAGIHCYRFNVHEPAGVWIRDRDKCYIIDMDPFTTAVGADHTGAHTLNSSTRISECYRSDYLDLGARVPAIGDVSEWTRPYHAVHEFP